MPESLKICFVASEMAPFAKTGGLADVAAALPAQLSRAGHDVRIFVPLYSAIDRDSHPLEPLAAVQDVPVEIGSRTLRFSLRGNEASASRPAMAFVDCPELYSRSEIYTSDDDEPIRFALLCRAVLESCQRIAWAPDIFHCNDWHTALIPPLLRSIYEWDNLFSTSRTLLSIHNIGYQGSFPRAVIEEIGLQEWSHLFDQDELAAGRVNFLRTGLIYADILSTVSPTYAREIQSAEYGMGLERLLHSRRDTLVGILNGVDYGVWDPEIDKLIPHNYSAGDLEGKRRNKRHLMQMLELDGGERTPLVGIISRLAYQKGFDLCFDVLPEMLADTDARLVVLGSGEERYEEFFEQLQQRHPGRSCFHRGYHDELAHVIEAASDLFLMPSRYEPCGLNQMFGMKYGTIPVVRKTGGLADSVEPFDRETGRGSGFVFEHFTADGLRWALSHALETYREPETWDHLVQNAMARNFSWNTQAGAYVELYKRILQH